MGLACDTLDLIPFLTGVGEAARVVRASVKIANKTIDVADSVKDIAKVTNKLDDAIDTSVDSVRYTEKVVKQMSNSSDLNHSFPALIDTFVDIKSGRPFKGGDGIVRTRIEIPGKIKNTPGVYEYIIEPNGMCNHRYFKKR